MWISLCSDAVPCARRQVALASCVSGGLAAVPAGPLLALAPAFLVRKLQAITDVLSLGSAPTVRADPHERLVRGGFEGARITFLVVVAHPFPVHAERRERGAVTTIKVCARVALLGLVFRDPQVWRAGGSFLGVSHQPDRYGISVHHPGATASRGRTEPQAEDCPRHGCERTRSPESRRQRQC